MVQTDDENGRADAPGATERGTEDHRTPGRIRSWWGRANGPDPERGMATAEYAIATVAAAGFAGLLILILRSDEVREMLLAIVRGALSV